MRRVRVSYSGRVHGVGFRATARSIAGRHGVSGWVRNEPDGTVSLEAQGSDDQVRRLLEDLRMRMERHIEGERVDDIEPREDESGFAVRT